MSQLRSVIDAADKLLDQQPVDSEALRQAHQQLKAARQNIQWPSSPDEVKDWERDCVEADEIIVLIEIVVAGKGVNVNDPQESVLDGEKDIDEDELLIRLAEARERKVGAEADIRILLAYGREVLRPRSCLPADLARAAGLSTSDVRDAYDSRDVYIAKEIFLRP